MNEQFFTTLEGRLAELTKDLRFQHKPTGAMIAPQIIGVMLERPTVAVQEAEEYPYVRWLIVDGSFTNRSPARFTVLLDGGIYTGGSVADGNADINRLCLALGKIVESPWFDQFKMKDQVRFSLGIPGDDKNPGIQPHPYHHCRLFLDIQGYQ